ncbi:glycosyltransferase, partial [Clostridium perfringens]|nr:glycosyltransferase [Clostridium perfringens]
HSHHRYTTFICRMAKMNSNLQVVHSEHNVFPSKNFINLRGKNIISVSQSVKDNLIKHVVKEKNITVIYNGIDEKKYINANKIDLKKELNIEGFTFGFIGRLSEQKGIRYMLEAFKSIVNEKYDCNLVLIGDGELRTEIKNFIEVNKLEKNIFMTGFRNDIINIISSLDMYILPSIFEGFPMTNME